MKVDKKYLPTIKGRRMRQIRDAVLTSKEHPKAGSQRPIYITRKAEKEKEAHQ